MNRKLETLLCSTDISKPPVSIPVDEIMAYCSKADSVDPEEALRYLAEMYIDNCGVSIGLRSFADYCSVYWIHRLMHDENTTFTAKYGDAQTLPELLPFLSSEYTEEIDSYDIMFMSDEALRDILIDELHDDHDEKTKIILCAGICDFLLKISNS